MARDYKHRRAAAPKKQPVPGWVWLLTGFAIASFAWFLFYITTDSSPTQQAGPVTAPAKAPPREAPPPSQPAKKEDDPASRFSFFTELPNMELEVPDFRLPGSADQQPAPPPTRASARPPASAATPKSQAAYVLQVGSFRDYRQADSMKAQLALLGVEARIQTVTVNDSQQWHRVRAGPYHDETRLQAVRAKLARNDIQSIVLKLGR
jgi:cell division protein FtsN